MHFSWQHNTTISVAGEETIVAARDFKFSKQLRMYVQGLNMLIVNLLHVWYVNVTLRTSKGGREYSPWVDKDTCYWSSMYLVDSVRYGSLGINLSPVYRVWEILHHLLNSIGTREYNKRKAPEEKRKREKIVNFLGYTPDLQSAQ